MVVTLGSLPREGRSWAGCAGSAALAGAGPPGPGERARAGLAAQQGGLMLEVRRDHRCCDRFAATETAVRTSRRRLLKDAVLRSQDAGADDAGTGLPVPGDLPRAITGTVRDISPHVLVIGNGASDTRITLTAS